MRAACEPRASLRPARGSISARTSSRAGECGRARARRPRRQAAAPPPSGKRVRAVRCGGAGGPAPAASRRALRRGAVLRWAYYCAWQGGAHSRTASPRTGPASGNKLRTAAPQRCEQCGWAACSERPQRGAVTRLAAGGLRDAHVRRSAAAATGAAAQASAQRCAWQAQRYRASSCLPCWPAVQSCGVRSQLQVCCAHSGATSDGVS